MQSLLKSAPACSAFHAYFDHSIVGLAITSLDKGWIEVNGALCATLGYTRDELTRMNWVDLTYPEDLAADQEQFNRMLSGEIKGYAMDKRFIHKDGHLVDTRLAVGRVCKPDGKLDYVVAMVEDVSDRRKAEKEYEDMFREMLDGFACTRSSAMQTGSRRTIASLLSTRPLSAWRA
jgi:PAS domain S-box-containing protein